ncbi:MAG: glycosyltransferase [Candidatus Bathyarchaeia archaeon]|jgi:glycosyltransferase involved in cell wall biosynthesis
MPEVSVIIPTYQSRKFVEAAIDSVLTQTYTNYEIIIVDGGSTDGTLEILHSYGKNVKILRQTGKGIANARNTGLLASQGKYVAFLDSDDLWLPDKLEIQIKLFDKMPEDVGLIYSDTLPFFERYKKLNLDSAFQKHMPRRGKVLSYLLRDNFIPTSTVIVRKSCFDKVGFFDESFLLSEDYDLWLRIAEEYDIDYQEFALAKHRLHEENITRNFELHFQNELLLQNKILPYLKKEASSKHEFYKMYYQPYLSFGIEWFYEKDTKKSRQKIKQYIELYPYNFSAFFFFFLTFVPISRLNTPKLGRIIPLKVLADLIKYLKQRS